MILILPFAKTFCKHKERISQMILLSPFSRSARGSCSGCAQAGLLPKVGAERHLVLLGFFVVCFCFFFFVLLRGCCIWHDQKCELSYAYASLPGSQAKFGALCSTHFTQTSLMTVGAVYANCDKI